MRWKCAVISSSSPAGYAPARRLDSTRARNSATSVSISGAASLASQADAGSFDSVTSRDRSWAPFNMAAMRVMVTGGAGFIGANFVHYMVETHPEYDVVVVDAFTYAGHRSSIASVAERLTVVEADICDEAAMDGTMADCDVVVHFAAESHVDRSIDDPGPFLRTNILGTETLLRMARKHEVARFHHISTDEVFGALTLGGGRFNEETPYAPRSPYAASKAASDHL